ncbi:MAG: transcriptional regulator, partial [Armatimonadetes bacterium]|nr:transcriptional regulator [Armatimonadota bacterium]
TRRLEEAEYITVSKTFEGRMPRTTYSLTKVGREQLDKYWRIMDEIRAGGAAT